MLLTWLPLLPWLLALWGRGYKSAEREGGGLGRCTRSSCSIQSNLLWKFLTAAFNPSVLTLYQIPDLNLNILDWILGFCACGLSCAGLEQQQGLQCGESGGRKSCYDVCVGEEAFHSILSRGISGQVPNEMIRSPGVLTGIITESIKIWLERLKDTRPTLCFSPQWKTNI